MRISDWSSDVCSSDLKITRLTHHPHSGTYLPTGSLLDENPGSTLSGNQHTVVVAWLWLKQASVAARALGGATQADRPFYTGKIKAARFMLKEKLPDAVASRSEEHTSDLQSLMRTSYAVFYL